MYFIHYQISFLEYVTHFTQEFKLLTPVPGFAWTCCPDDVSCEAHRRYDGTERKIIKNHMMSQNAYFVIMCGACSEHEIASRGTIVLTSLYVNII